MKWRSWRKSWFEHTAIDILFYSVRLSYVWSDYVGGYCDLHIVKEPVIKEIMNTSVLYFRRGILRWGLGKVPHSAQHGAGHQRKATNRNAPGGRSEDEEPVDSFACPLSWCEFGDGLLTEGVGKDNKIITESLRIVNFHIRERRVRYWFDLSDCQFAYRSLILYFKMKQSMCILTWCTMQR